MENFLFGGLAASASICLLNPVDVVKSRMQFQGELGGGKQVYKGIGDALLKIGRTEGLPGLYHGLGPAICFQMSGNACRFGVYYLGKRALGIDSEAQLSAVTSFQLAIVAGAFSSIFACPFFAIKTSMQVQSSSGALAVGTQHGYTGTFQALRSIVEQRGFLGLYRGLDALLPRILALVSVQLTVYDAMKGRLIAAGYANGTPVHFAASAVASLCASVAMQPFDLVAARLMNQPDVAGQPALYRGPFDCMRKIVATEGVWALSKGGLSNYMRIGPHYILTFVFFERMKGAWRNFQAARPRPAPQPSA